MSARSTYRAIELRTRQKYRDRSALEESGPKYRALIRPIKQIRIGRCHIDQRIDIY